MECDRIQATVKEMPPSQIWNTISGPNDSEIISERAVAISGVDRSIMKLERISRLNPNEITLKDEMRRMKSRLKT